MKNTYILNKITALSETIPKLPSIVLMMLLAIAILVERCVLWGVSEHRIAAVTIALTLGLSLLAFFLKHKQLAHFVFLRKAMLLTMIMAACLGKVIAQPVCASEKLTLRVIKIHYDGFDANGSLSDPRVIAIGKIGAAASVTTSCYAIDNIAMPVDITDGFPVTSQIGRASCRERVLVAV